MLRQRLQQTQRRLTRTIILSSAIPAFLVAAGALLFALAGAEQEYRRVASEEIVFHAEAYAQDVRTRLQSALTSLYAFAAVGQSQDSERLDSFLERTRSVHGWIEGMAVVDENGARQFSCGSPASLPPEILSSVFDARGREKGAVITRVFAAANGPARFFILSRTAAPGRAVYLSANAVEFSATLDRVRFGRTGEIFLVSRDGVLQTRSIMHGGILDTADPALALDHPRSGVLLTREWKGTSMWYALSPIAANPDWIMVAQRDEREILQYHETWIKRFAAFGIAGLALLAASVALAARVTGRIQRRIEEERALLAEHQLQVQKLDAISQLGVGIAHEVNNPLAIIGEEAGWMQDVLKREALQDVPGSDELRDSLRQITTQIGRCREITLKLLSFGGKSDGIIRDVDVNALVSDAVTLRRREASQKNIVIEERPAAGLPVVHTEPTLLRQLLLNLINNAMDAMPGGGSIVISTRRAEQAGVVLSVEDTGFGIPEENMHRLFEPFFSTKPPGKGAGLGLSICHGILQRIGGEIFVTSTPGKGSTFTVELPLTPRHIGPLTD